MEEGPTVTILLLGDEGCGKSTFLARLAQPRHTISNPVTPSTPLPVLRDLDQPFTYTIRLYNRPYTFEFYDTSSPEHWTRLAPDFVVICFDIDNRESLQHAKTVWKREVAISFGADREAKLPLMLLGLKRDLRCMKDSMIWPQEALNVAQEMRCDLYAECSAITGELMREAFEDLAKTAAKTTTLNGGQTPGFCSIM